MAKRNGRRVNTSRGFPSWKHNSSLSSRSASSANNGTSSPSAPTLDCASDDERTWNVHGDSETTPSELANTRGSRRPARSRGGQQSWVVTLLSLLTVHVVLLVAYGVHSRWQWATELTDYLAAVTLVLCASSVLIHGQVIIIFVVSVCLYVCLFVCLFVCAEFFSAGFDPISIKLGHMLYVWV